MNGFDGKTGTVKRALKLLGFMSEAQVMAHLVEEGVTVEIAFFAIKAARQLFPTD
jgi:hypothetical protein